MCRTHRANVPAARDTRSPGWDVLPASEPTIRVSDRDREAVAAQLGEQTAAGRLTLAEFEERVAAAHGARTRGELDQLVIDLPRPRTRPEPRPRRSYEHWRPWFTTAVICLAVWAAASLMARDVGYFWPFWVIVPWGIMLASHGWSRPRRADRRSLAR